MNVFQWLKIFCHERNHTSQNLSPLVDILQLTERSVFIVEITKGGRTSVCWELTCMQSTVSRLWIIILRSFILTFVVKEQYIWKLMFVFKYLFGFYFFFTMAKK